VVTFKAPLFFIAVLLLVWLRLGFHRFSVGPSSLGHVSNQWRQDRDLASNVHLFSFEPSVCRPAVRLAGNRGAGTGLPKTDDSSGATRWLRQAASARVGAAAAVRRALARSVWRAPAP